MKRRNFLQLAAAAPLFSILPRMEKPKIEIPDEPPKLKVQDLTRKQLLFFRALAKNHGSYLVHDFSEALGDTIMEKYESFYLDMVRISVMVHRRCNGLPGPKTDAEFWHLWRQMAPDYTVTNCVDAANFIITTPMIASVPQTATCGWNGPYYDWREPNHPQKEPVRYLGSINARWRLFTSCDLQPWDIIFGTTDDNDYIRMSKNHWGYMKMINFII